jgi:hypothetical protein
MIKLTGKGFNFNEVARKLAANRRIIKVEAGGMAVKHFKGNFRAQGFIDEVLDPWQKRKAPSKKKTSRAILVKTGHLRNSIRVLGMPGDRVILGTRGIKYAKRHNEGLVKMPKRQFIGNSRLLEGRIHKLIDRQIRKAWG